MCAFQGKSILNNNNIFITIKIITYSRKQRKCIILFANESKNSNKFNNNNNDPYKEQQRHFSSLLWYFSKKMSRTNSCLFLKCLEEEHF